MKKVISVLLSVVMLLSMTRGINFVVFATEKTLMLNDNWIEGDFSETNKRLQYRINVDKDSKVTLKLMKYADVYYNLYNDDFSQCIDSTNRISGSESSPTTNTFKYSLSKGVYYIVISQDNHSNSGKIKIKGIASHYNNSETEPNDYDNATVIDIGKTMIGALTVQDSLDWYVFHLKQKANVRITVTNYTAVYYRAYNSDLSQCIDWTNRIEGTVENPITRVGEYTLSSGYYYICISRDNHTTGGKYTLNVSVNYNVSKPTSFKASSHKTTSLKLSWNKVAGVSGYQLQQYKSNKWTTIRTTSSNSYTVSGLKAGTTYKFRVRAYKTVDGKKYYSSWSQTMTTPTKPNTPTIKAPSTNRKHQIKVKWKTVSACSGYQVQYSKKSDFSSIITTKTVSGQSKTSCTGNNFNKGRKYYVRVRAYKTVNGKKYYSSWSKSKSIVSK